MYLIITVFVGFAIAFISLKFKNYNTVFNYMLALLSILIGVWGAIYFTNINTQKQKKGHLINTLEASIDEIKCRNRFINLFYDLDSSNNEQMDSTIIYKDIWNKNKQFPPNIASNIISSESNQDLITNESLFQLRTFQININTSINSINETNNNKDFISRLRYYGFWLAHIEKQLEFEISYQNEQISLTKLKELITIELQKFRDDVNSKLIK
jgi:hypothetical protein